MAHPAGGLLTNPATATIGMSRTWIASYLSRSTLASKRRLCQVLAMC